MNKKWLIFIILALLAINIYTMIGFRRFKQQNASEYVNDELHTLKVNFWTNIENSNIQLEATSVKDSSNNVLLLNDIWENGQKQMLVCRFSESHCESCVDYSIRQIHHWVDSIGKENLLFLGAYRNNKIFNKTKPLYNIHHLNVYNVSSLNMPAEELGFPYFFILSSNMTVSNVFVPDKATPAITQNYLKMINKRYFSEEEPPLTPP
ncbi:MAG: hypothetical protein LBE91_10735 [Tannerella sp.]|jgi:hypothetical protein|nr:hypothetical protein [Tannerella sp.]